MSRTFFDVIHSGNILQQLWQRCESEEFCDVVLIAGTEKKRIPAHRNILSIASVYFNKVLDENTAKEVEMPSLNGDMLQRVIEYCYTGRIVISKDNAVELLETAHMLFLNYIIKACESILADQLHPSNCCELAHLAERYHCKTLSEKAKDCSLKELLKMYETEEFLSLKVEQVSQLLASDDLRVESEEKVFKSLLKWIEHDQSEREKHKVDLLKLVRLPLLQRSFLIESVKPICTSTECFQIYVEALENNLSQDSTSASKSIKPDQFLMGIDKFCNTVHYYCPQENKWLHKSFDNQYCLPNNFGFTVMENDLFIAGGRKGMGIALSTFICLNLKTMTIKELNPMQQHRSNFQLAVLNGFIYAVGGITDSLDCALNSVEKWDPITNNWAQVSSMSAERYDFGLAILNDKLYVVGGSSDGNPLNCAECYDPIQDLWQSIASMRESRQSLGLAVANGLLYAVGGFKHRTVERYDPQTNKWSPICTLRESHSSSYRCITFHGKVVVCYDDHIDEYDTATNKWKEIVSFERFDIYGIFSYPDKILTAEFHYDKFPLPVGSGIFGYDDSAEF